MTSYPIRSVGVFCGSSDRVADVYHHAARELGDQLAAAGWITVYGGGGVGLMGTLARAALKRHGKVVGVRPRFITDLEGDQMGLTELIATDTMHERIAMIFEMSDAFVALPGSCGTLDEVVQAITWKRLSLHNKPVAILDVADFYRPLAEQFERMIEDQFIVSTYREISRFCCDVPAVMEYLRTYRPPKPLF